MKIRKANAMFRLKAEEMKLEGLQIQCDLLEAIQVRHKIWADDSPDPEIECAHLEIIELIGQTRGKYAVLLARYSNLGEPQAP
jgi:hypothetical protein